MSFTFKIVSRQNAIDYIERAALLVAAICALSSTVVLGQTVSINYNSSVGLGATPANGMGLGVAVYDSNLMDAAVPALVNKAGYDIMRYPGGSYADVYHWQTSTATGGAYVVPADTFDNFMSQVRAAGTTAIITTNYGSNIAGTGGGDPNEAAAWVNYANNTKGYGIKYWEVGNEVYGNGEYGASWEEDLHTSHTPTTYADNFNLYANAIHAVDASAQVGAVITGPGLWPDGVSPDWDSTVLPIVCPNVNFVIIHWYPSSTGGLTAPEDQQPTIASTTRARLKQYCPSRSSQIQIMITEGNWTGGVQIQGALFAADQFIAWWENGVAGMDWQNLHNGSDVVSGVNLDSGVLSNGTCTGSTCEPAVDTPFPAYYGAQMVHELTAPGDTLLSATSSSTNVAVHAVKSTSGKIAIMLINKTSGTLYVPVSIGGTSVNTTGTQYFYGQNSSSVQQSSISGLGSTFTATLPAYSITDIVTSVSSGSSGGNLLSNGTYTLTAHSNNLVADDPGYATTPGTYVDQWTSGGGNNQKWILTNLGNNNVTLVNVANNLVLDVYQNSKSNGGKIDMWTPTGATNQQWHITAVSGGYYQITSVSSGLALDVPGFSTTQGVDLDQWAVNGGTNQQWSIQ